jgi:hypothetical protein
MCRRDRPRGCYSSYFAPIAPYCTLVTTALPPQAAIRPADPLLWHRAHSIRVNAVDPVTLRSAGLSVDAEHALQALCDALRQFGEFSVRVRLHPAKAKRTGRVFDVHPIEKPHVIH